MHGEDTWAISDAQSAFTEFEKRPAWSVHFLLKPEFLDVKGFASRQIFDGQHPSGTRYGCHTSPYSKAR
jgi:hypothetical protein